METQVKNKNGIQTFVDESFYTGSTKVIVLKAHITQPDEFKKTDSVELRAHSCNDDTMFISIHNKKANEKGTVVDRSQSIKIDAAHLDQLIENLKTIRKTMKG